MKKILTIMLLSVLSVFFVSCHNDDDESTTEQYYSGCFNLVIDNQTGTQNIFTGGSYTFKFHNTSGIVDITVNNLYLTENGSSVSFELTGLIWGYSDEGARIASVASVTPTSNGQALSDYTVQNVELYLLERYMITGEYIPVIKLSMTVNGVYDVVAVQTQVSYFGNTVVTDETGTVFTTESPYYVVYFDVQNQTASVFMYNEQFTSSMTETNLVCSGIDYTLSKTGYTLECDNLIPTVSGTSNPDYEITNLNGNVSFSSGGILRFNCMSTYDVEAVLGFF